MAFQCDDITVIGDDRKDFDPQVAEQLTTKTVAAGQQNAQMNSVLGRHNMDATGTVLPLGVQANQAGSLNQLTSIQPLDAEAVNDLQRSQMASQVAGLNAATRIPGAGMIK